MAENTKIEWADHTFNPWIGCTRISGACDHCYAADLSSRYGWAKWGNGERRQRTSPANWKKPLQWNAKAAETGERPRVFCLSLGDWADVEVPGEWRDDLFAVIDRCRNLDWLLLTKRHTAAQKFLPATPWPHVRIGMTVEDEDAARMRLPRLAMLSHYGWKTFVSYEPALGPVNWWPWLDPEGVAAGCIGWLIAGGESGPKARPAHPDWFRAARDACARAGISYLFKQWGEWLPGQNDPLPNGGRRVAHWQDGRWGPRRASNPERNYVMWEPDGTMRLGGSRSPASHFEVASWAQRVGKKAAGRLLDGIEHNGFPL